MIDVLINFFGLIQQVLIWLIFIRVILSWLRIYNRFMLDTTEWMLRPIRRLLPPVGGMLDLSPLIAVLLLQVIGDGILNWLLMIR